MSTEANKAIAQRVIDEGFNGRQLAVFDELVAPGFVNVDSSSPAVTDLESFKVWVQAMWAAFPDFKVEIIEAIAEGDYVVHVWRTRGTQTGPFMGLPVTGKQFENDGLSVNTLSGGKIARTLWGYNGMTMLQQLGVMPAMTGA